jgi:hypothetical protein
MIKILKTLLSHKLNRCYQHSSDPICPKLYLLARDDGVYNNDAHHPSDDHGVYDAFYPRAHLYDGDHDACDANVDDAYVCAYSDVYTYPGYHDTNFLLKEPHLSHQ